MTQSINPAVATRDLVLWYDMKDPVSYKGEPTTNILKNEDGVRIDQNQGSTGNNGMVAAPPCREINHSGRATHIKFNNAADQYGCCPNHMSYGNVQVSGSTQYTISYYLREIEGNARGGNYIYRYEYGPSGYIKEGGLFSSSRVREIDNGWKKVWGTLTTDSNTQAMQLYSFNYVKNTPIEMMITGYQIEQKPYPTRYVEDTNGIRTNTTALLDLSEDKRTITLNSMTYGAEDAISFAAGNYLTLSSMPVDRYNWSAEFVFNSIDTGNVFICVPQSNGIDQAFRYDGNNQRAGVVCAVQADTGGRAYYATDGSAPRNAWNHVIFQRDQNNFYIWTNGVKETFSDTTDNGLFNGSWVVGQRGNGQGPFNGEIPICRVYNRVLTDEEALGNFESVRGRFGI